MNQIAKDIVSLPVSSAAFPASRRGIVSVPGSQIQYNASKFRQSEVESMINRISRVGEKVDSFAKGIREHMRIGSKISETVKGKLSLGAKILQLGGVKKVFQQNFSVKEGEQLLKVSQCYLSTTAGPLAGLVFISTDKVAFCSERSIKISSSSGEIIRVHYKVVIPLGKIKRANESENVKQPSRKYIQIVTKDNYDFWFMGFLNYRRTLKFIQHAMSQVQ